MSAQKPNQRQVVISMSDLHFGARTHLNATLCDTLEAARKRALAFDPSRIILLLNGDTVDGQDIYRGHAKSLTVTLAVEQVVVAAWSLKRFLISLQKENGGPKVSVEVTFGNHDLASSGDNLAMQLVKELRLLGVVATYHGREVFVNLATGKHHHWLMAEHGFGGSRFYPRSPALQEHQVRRALEEAMHPNEAAPEDRIVKLTEAKVAKEVAQSGRLIRRFTTGHVHWFQIGAQMGSLICDVTGGFQRHERYNLSSVNRPTGVTLYLGEGDAVETVPIQPDEAIYRRESIDPDLHEQNMQLAARAIIEHRQWSKQIGLIP